MAHQLQEKSHSIYNNIENSTLTTAQSYQNSIQVLKPAPNFSPITIISDAPSLSSCTSNNCLPYNIEDSNDSDKNFPISPDVANKIDEIINNKEFDFENLSCSADDDWWDQELNKLDMNGLRNIDESIQYRIMTVKTQPPENIRRRYESDGKRQIEQSRYKPMAINLPNLNNCQLNPNQSFWIQLLLITYSKNSEEKVYNHIDKLEYHAEDLPEADHGFVRVPLTDNDIQRGIKQFARISIIKTKLDKYTFELIPFNPLIGDNQIEIYENQNTKTVVAKAKCFRDKYNLKASRIACQLVIKQNETWHMTNITCATNMMEEKEKLNKRSSISNTSDDGNEDEYQVHRPSPAKKRKRSSLLTQSLPITRVKEL